MSIRLRRPKFFVALGGAAVAWPFEARAQEPVTPVIGSHPLVDRLVSDGKELRRYFQVKRPRCFPSRTRPPSGASCSLNFAPDRTKKSVEAGGSFQRPSSRSALP